MFGRNTEGGALSLVTRAPSGVFGGRIGGSYGNYGAYNGEIHIDLPEYHNFSVKLDGIKQYQGATTADPIAGQTGWNYYDRQGFRAAVRWTPTSDITDDFSYDVAQDKNTPFYSQLLNYNPNGCPSGGTNAVPIAAGLAPACAAAPGTAFTGLSGTVRPLLPGVVVNGSSRQRVADIGVPQQPSIDNTHGFTNVLKWKVSPEIELRSITSWRGVEATQWDNSGGAHRVPAIAIPAIGSTNPTTCTAAAPCAFSRYSLADLRQNQFSQEFQAVGTVGPVDYVAGLYYFNERVRDDAATPNSNGIVAITTPTSPTVNTVSSYQYVILDPCRGFGQSFGSQPGCRSIDRASEVRSKSYAAFGQVTWNVFDALHLTVGARYTHDEKQGLLVISRNVVYEDTPFARSIYATYLPFAVNAAAATANGYQRLDRTWNRFNPTATIAYDVSDTVHVYAKYATGYRAGGASSRTSDYRAFNPEDVKSYEIGLKSDLFDHRARINIAGYLMDRKNSQVDLSTIQPTAGGNFNNLVTFNAPGITKIRGIEADITVKPFQGLTLTGGYAYTYTDIPAVPITYQGLCTGVNNPTPANNPGGATCLAAGQLLNSTTVNQKFYIVFTPKNAASGSIDYTTPIGDSGTNIKFHVDANYAQATQAFDQFATKADASFIVNGRIALVDIPVSDNGQKFTVGIWGRNIFDYQYVFRRDPSNSLAQVQTTTATIGNVGNTIGDYGNYNAPRTFGVEASLKF